MLYDFPSFAEVFFYFSKLSSPPPPLALPCPIPPQPALGLKPGRIYPYSRDRQVRIFCTDRRIRKPAESYEFQSFFLFLFLWPSLFSPWFSLVFFFCSAYACLYLNANEPNTVQTYDKTLRLSVQGFGRFLTKSRGYMISTFCYVSARLSICYPRFSYHSTLLNFWVFFNVTSSSQRIHHFFKPRGERNRKNLPKTS